MKKDGVIIDSFTMFLDELKQIEKKKETKEEKEKKNDGHRDRNNNE